MVNITMGCTPPPPKGAPGRIIDELVGSYHSDDEFVHKTGRITMHW
ncbi:MAG TPA: hypothetical protein PLV96_09975 [Methanoregulaceae archaeon]|nr:hypothetical protein [Methanoregulaceae archaeon]